MIELKYLPAYCHNYRIAVKKMGINWVWPTVKMTVMYVHSVIFAVPKTRD